jgi:hypothetical protein
MGMVDGGRPGGTIVTGENFDGGSRTSVSDDGGRRSFLKKVGVGAAVAWTAPVLTTRAASAGPGTPPTCVVWGTSVLDRDDSGTITTGVLPLSAYPLTSTPGTTQVSIEVAGNSYHATEPFPSGIDDTFPRTNPTSFHTQMFTSGTGPLTITITFDSPVRNLEFTLLDIDTGQFIDNVVTTPASDDTTFPAGGSTTVDEVVTDVEFEGTTPVGNSSNLGDVTLRYFGPLTSVVLTYSRAGAQVSQGIGISDICWIE